MKRFEITRHKAIRHTICAVLIGLFTPPVLIHSALAESVTQRVAESQTLRVALFIDKGAEASEFTKEFDRSTDDSILYKTVDGDDIRNGALRHFDALVVPGGSAAKEARSMGPEAREEVRRFVNEGGVYMGICAGAYLASRASETDIGLLPLKTLDSEHWYRVDDATPVDVELTQTGMEVFGIGKSDIRVKYENGPIFAFSAEKSDAGLVPLGFFRSEVVANGGERGVMRGAPAIICTKIGRGFAMAISPHFEETMGLKQVQLHALHWLYDHRSSGTISTTASKSKGGGTISNARPGVGMFERSREHPLENQNVVKNASVLQNVEPAVSDLGERALKLAEHIFESATDVSYVHRHAGAAKQVITESDGSCDARTDCSGFISNIVYSIGPRHYHAIRSLEPNASYPQAKIWARFFDGLDSRESRDGWLGISNWKDLKPGDFIAWEEGKNSTSGNTGHVMLATGKPSEIMQRFGYRYFEISVIDSSSVYHFAPESLPPEAHQKHRDGLGKGTVRILLSEDNRPIGYWAGTYWGEGQKEIHGPTLSQKVRFARMMSLEDASQGHM